MEEINYGEIQQLLDGLLGSDLDFQAMVESGAAGESPLSWKRLASLVQSALFEELLAQKQLWMHILVLAFAATLLLHFADVFQNRSVPEISFCMIYMILFLLLISSFQTSLGIAREVMEAMRSFMTVLAPAWLLAMTLSSYLTSAGVYYEFILLLISGVQWLAESFVLPCAEIYVLLVLVNHLSREKRLGQFAELMSMAADWSLKVALALVCGFHMIQGLVSPAADSFRNQAISRGIGMVPGVGSAGSGVTDLVLGSAVLIKNGIGAAALIVLILLCLIPLVKLAVIMAVYYLLAAVLQPVSDERIVGCLSGMGNGVRLLFRAVFTVLALFFLSIALMTALTGG
ncbi:MAG: stage III sporulation protein AE [Lachnospiraceae bacterium]|nr:stage III sporulation protein AE [Lachnospiraceae bacterium]